MCLLLPGTYAPYWRVNCIRSSSTSKRQWEDGNRVEKGLPTSTIFNLLEKALGNESKPNGAIPLHCRRRREGHSSCCVWENVDECQRTRAERMSKGWFILHLTPFLYEWGNWGPEKWKGLPGSYRGLTVEKKTEVDWLALWAPTHSLGTLPKLNPYITTWSRFHYPSFIDKNTEVQAGPVQRWKLCNGNFLRLTLQGVLDLVQASTLHLSTLICRVKPQALVHLSHSRFTPVVPVSLVIAPLSLSEVPQLGESCLVTLLSTKWKY